MKFSRTPFLLEKSGGYFCSMPNGLNVRPLTAEVLIVSHILWTQGKQTTKATMFYSTFYNYILFLIYNYSLSFTTKFYKYILFH